MILETSHLMIIHQSGSNVTWTDEISNNPSMGFLKIFYGLGPFRVLETGKSLSGQHDQILEIDVPHSKGVRTWICASLVCVAAA